MGQEAPLAFCSLPKSVSFSSPIPDSLLRGLRSSMHPPCLLLALSDEVSGCLRQQVGTTTLPSCLICTVINSWPYYSHCFLMWNQHHATCLPKRFRDLPTFHLNVFNMKIFLFFKIVIKTTHPHKCVTYKFSTPKTTNTLMRAAALTHFFCRPEWNF